jgi:hypothetical protein
LDFDTPRDVRRVRLSTSARSLGDFPRDLLIEGADAIGEFTPLYRGSVVVPLGPALVRDPRHGPVDMWLSPNRITRLRIRQLGVTRTWMWAIDELSVWERTPGIVGVSAIH